MGDYVRAELVRHYRDPCVFSFLLGCSPAGTLILVWSGVKAPVVVGLIVQGLVALVMNYLGVKFGRTPRVSHPQTPCGNGDSEPAALGPQATSPGMDATGVAPGEA